MNEDTIQDVTTAQAPPLPAPSLEVVAVDREDITQAKTTFLVDPSLLTIDFSRNGRYAEPNQKKVKEYAESFAERGQLHPIRVKKVNSGLVVTYGFHRALAGIFGIDSGLLPSDWKIRYELDETETDQDSFLSNVAENAEHQKLTVMDEATIYRKLTSPVPDGFAMTSAEACKALGKKPRFANSVMHLFSLPKRIQKAVHEGRVSGECGYEVAMTGELGLTVLDKLLSKSERVLQGDWREAMREAKEAGKAGSDGYSERSGGMEGDAAESGDVVATGRKKKKVKRGSEERVPKRTMKEVLGILDEVITAKEGGVDAAKKLKAICAGRGTANSAVKYIQTLTSVV